MQVFAERVSYADMFSGWCDLLHILGSIFTDTTHFLSHIFLVPYPSIKVLNVAKNFLITLVSFFYRKDRVDEGTNQT